LLNMKAKKLSFAILATTLVIFGSCSDDKDKGPSHEFTYGDKAFSLKGANMYLINNSVCCNNHSIRAYSITDGVYSKEPGWGWEAEDYTGETYFLIITLLEPNGGEHGTGEYPMYPWIGEESHTDVRIGYVDFFTVEDGNEIEYAPGDDHDNSPVVIQGGFDVDETLTVSFEGDLLQVLNAVPTTYESARVYFSGQIQAAQ
jgi:hypothetical protein